MIERKANLLKRFEEEGKQVGHLKNLTFGDIVKSVYHETHIHVRDYTIGKKKLRKDKVFPGYFKGTTSEQNRAEYEFRAYYKEFTTEGMPASSLKFYYWHHVVYGTGKGL